MSYAEDIHILVMDDERIIREGAERILTREGWKVSTAENGEKGLALIKQEPFHILLLDLMMPCIRGMDVLKSVRETHPHILVIVVTGYATVENAVEAMKSGAYDFIPKPFTPDQVRIVVRRAREKISLEREAEQLRRAADEVIRLAEAGGMSGYYAGGLDNAVVVEGLTSILISLNERYGVKTASIGITGIPN